MDQLKEQMYRAAAESANDAVAAVSKYEGEETSLWSQLPIGMQDHLWKHGREKNGGEKSDSDLKWGEPKTAEALREKVFKLALDYLKAAQPKGLGKLPTTEGQTPANKADEPKKEIDGGRVSSAGAAVKSDSPITAKDFQKESEKKC